jgi:DNA-binding transcriptional MerR regulator
MLNESQKEIFWRLWATTRGSKRLPVTLPYCGHEATEGQLEAKLWEYAEGEMSETEAERLWEQIQGCKYCLQKLLNIQQAISQSQEKGYSLAEIKTLIAQQEKANVLKIAVKFVKDSLKLISCSGLLLAQEPLPVLRRKVKSTSESTPCNLRISKDFDKYKIEAEIEKITPQTCNLGVKIEPVQGGVSISGLRMSLSDNKKILASYMAQDGKCVFTDITCGYYTLTLTRGEDILGKVLLDIE